MKPFFPVLFLTLFFCIGGGFSLPRAGAQTSGWLWGQVNSGAGIDAYVVAADPSGNSYGGGINYTNTTAYFGGNALTSSAVAGGIYSYQGGFIQACWVKYSPTGTPMWADGTQNADAWLYNITTDASGNFIVFGAFDSPTMTLDGTIVTNPYTSTGGNQYFLAKYSPSGALLWVKADGYTPDNYHGFLGVCIITTGGVTTDAAGNIYITSSYQPATLTIGGHTYNNTDPSGTTSDIFVAKYNASGALQWASSAGGNSDDFAYGIAVGSGGNVYVTGAFWSSSATYGSSVIADPYGAGGYSLLGTGGIPLAYIAEFSPTGTPLWAQAAGGSNGAYGVGLVSDQSGNVYMTGAFGDATISFGATTLTRTYPAAVPELALFLVQYSPSNTVTWSKTIGSATTGAWGYAIGIAGCGEVWVSGTYSSDVSIDGSTLAIVPGWDPVFIAGYNLSGGVIGYSGLGSGGDDQNSIACDPNGNVFICSDYFDLTGTVFSIGPDVMPLSTSDELLYVGKYANIAVGPKDTTYKTTDTTLCNAANITLTAPATYSSYLWDNSTTAMTRTVTSSGSFWVICTSTCAVPTLIDTFDVIISPTDTTHKNIDTTACGDGFTATLSGDPGFSNYSWNTGSTSSSISVSTGGTYWLQESNGCAMGLDTFNVALGAAPEVYLGHNTSLCIGNTVILHCQEPAGTTYLWNTGSTDTELAVTGGGDYSLTVSENGCTATSSVTVQFLQPPSPLHIGPDTTLCDEPSYTISSGDNATTWNTGQRGPHITVSYSGTFVASLSNECGILTDTVKVQFDNCVILVPDAFTPNNDGKNDFFKVTGLNLAFYQDFSLGIYNRFGQRVFYTSNVDNGWDGTFNGTPQDLGTYFYLVRYTLNGESHMLKGDLELIR